MKHFHFILCTLLIISCSNDTSEVQPPEEDLHATIQYNQVNGVDPNLLSLDIYYNSNITLVKPVVIYVHGGGWSIGDKSNQLENKIQLFRSLDYIFISINYRLSPFPSQPNNPNRIMYPTHNLDVADAIKWVVENIDKYGGNPHQIGLLGHSAGAHLVSLIATNPDFLSNVGLSFKNIKAVASIDTEGYDVSAKVLENNDLYINAFGTDKILNLKASPLYNILEDVSYPNFFIAKRGNSNRLEIANKFIAALEESGTTVYSVDGGIYNHSGINQAIGAPEEIIITEALKTFFLDSFK